MYSDTQAIEAFKQSLEAAYKAGYAAGGNEMRAAIMKAAGATESVLIETEKSEKTQRKNTDRAPRGSVRAAIFEALKRWPGLPTQDVGEKAAQVDPEVSPTSVGNELRRMTGKLYEIKAGRWYLIDREPYGAQKETERRTASGLFSAS